jgi:hypothetical protein
MGFQGTFKGTLKENFDRMMNPRKFLNEMDQFGNTQLSQMGIEQDTKKLQQDNGSRNLPPNQGKKITVNMKTSDIIRYATEFFKWRGVVDFKKVNALGSSDYDRFIEYLYSKPENIKESIDSVSNSDLSNPSKLWDESNINELGTGDGDGDPVFDRIHRDSASDWPEENDFRVDGHMTLSNSGGIEVEMNDSGDGVRYRFNDSGNPDEPHEAEIEYESGTSDDDSRTYFHVGSDKYYLDQFMRSNFGPGRRNESNTGDITEVAMPNLVENYNRLQLLNKKITKKNLNEVGFDQNGNPMGFDNSEEGYGDDPIDSRPKKGDAVYLQTPYPNIASRIMYIDSTHVFWKTDTTDQIDIGSKGGVLHIGQLRDKQLYNDLLTWMDTGDKTALETTKYTDI